MVKDGTIRKIIVAMWIVQIVFMLGMLGFWIMRKGPCDKRFNPNDEQLRNLQWIPQEKLPEK